MATTVIWPNTITNNNNTQHALWTSDSVYCSLQNSLANLAVLANSSDARDSYYKTDFSTWLIEPFGSCITRLLTGSFVICLVRMQTFTHLTDLEASPYLIFSSTKARRFHNRLCFFLNFQCSDMHLRCLH